MTNSPPRPTPRPMLMPPELPPPCIIAEEHQLALAQLDSRYAQPAEQYRRESSDRLFGPGVSARGRDEPVGPVADASYSRMVAEAAFGPPSPQARKGT
jgi:hypothetical protein